MHGVFNVMRVSQSPDYLNFVVNHPEVTQSNEFIDCTELFNRSIVYEYDGGCIAYYKLGDGIYEAHTQALKSGRGSALREFIKQTLSDLFENRGAKIIKSYAQHDNLPAKKLAKEFGVFTHSDSLFDYFEVTKEVFLCQQQL